MNTNHLQQLFQNYIDNFEMLNSPDHEEYYKWQVTKQFRPMMDAALDSSDDDFSAKLFEIRNITENLVDSYTQPFYGLCKFAEAEPKTVKDMLRTLFTRSNGSMEERQSAISEFLSKSHELRDKYFPESFLYKDDMHSVTTYLFLYNPDCNYIFKSSNAQTFADCIEFYDDWGSGDTMKLDVYYRMCDQVVDAINEDKAILKTDASRFENGWGVDPETFALDTEKHILACDLIYCCSAYDLFSNISFTRPKSKEKQLLMEKKERAMTLFGELKRSQEKLKLLEEALAYLDSVFVVGATVQHKKYGVGVIQNKTDSSIEIEFADGEKKKLGTVFSVANGIIESSYSDYDVKIRQYKEVLNKESAIKRAVDYAERAFEPYAEYLDK